jgi:hypothetical protein
MPTRSRLLASLAALLLCACFSMRLSAQSAGDSVALEKSIAAEHPDLPFVASARRRLLRQLHYSDLNGARVSIAFMARRAPAWLTAAEGLAAEALLADTTLLRDIPHLEMLMAGAASGPKQSPAYDDLLYRSEIDMLRERAEGLQDRFVAASPMADELLFYNLLVNHLYTRGYRAQEKLNARVDDFASRYPASPLAPLAVRYIKLRYAEFPIGLAFTAGYAAGLFSGDIADRYNYFHGPMIGGEVYLWELTVAAWIDFAVAKAPRDFTAGGRLWGAGSSSMVNAAFDAGYEIRLGRLAITPAVGLALQSLRGVAGASGDPADLPRTHDRLGLDLGVIVGYRIPFDLGPHIDFRAKLGRAQTSLSDYDPRFSGALWYVQFAFALVQRPYEGR